MKQKRRKRRKPTKSVPRRAEQEKTRVSPISRPRYLALALVSVAVAVPAAWWGYLRFASSGGQKNKPEPNVESVAETPVLRILCPFDGSVFPPDIAPTRFHWEDTTDSADRWTVKIEFDGDHAPMHFTSDVPEWTPPADAWERIKQCSVEAEATLTICGVNSRRPDEVLTEDRVSVRTSKDEVGAPVFYREVNLPFIEAVRDPGAHIRWRFGSISSGEQPPVVLDKMPLCGNCHSFSRDGALIGMDVDYGSDKGSYIICPVSREMTYDSDKIITWSDYKREDNAGTLGLLSQVSPDGRYVISTVEDRSVFAAIDGLAFSQLFFPIQGILAYYDRQTKTFHSLPGADDHRYVQSNPTWSPDGKYVVFARSEALQSERFREKKRGLIKAEDVWEFSEGGKTFKFDLFRIPFNDGQGGEPEPLLGASNNEMSNYFPKYSPDGKWIVFCRAGSFMLLQPDSALYIIPAEGGRARRLECNTSRMNSWHSWSPNGKWLVFSSKVFSPYTQLFLTHVDDQGRTTPPVALSHFTSDNMAANIPEFVNAAPDAIHIIRQEFVDDESYVEVGEQNMHEGVCDLAARAFQKALEINPENIEARVGLGGTWIALGKLDEAEEQLTEALSRDPANVRALCLQGGLFEKQDRFPDAMETFRRVLQIDPEYAQAHLATGKLLLKTGARDEGTKYLLEAARLDSDLVSPYVDLGNLFLREGNTDQAKAMFRQALAREPESDPALISLAIALIQDRDHQPRDIEEAVELAARACKLTNDEDVPALIVLTEAYAAAGRVREAESAARRALDAALQMGRPDRAATGRALLARIQQQTAPRRAP